MSDLLSRRAAVAADMSALFPAGPGPLTDPIAASPPRPHAVSPFRRRKSRILPSLVAVASIAGAGAGLMLTSEVGNRFAAPPPVTVQAARERTSPDQPVPAPVELAVAQVAAADRSAPVIMQVRQPRDLPRIASASKDESRQAFDACDEGDEAACLGGDMAAADRTLRAAYADAIDAGVGPRRLTAARDRWADLQQIGYDEPGRMIDGYADLADRLVRQARAARFADAW